MRKKILWTLLLVVVVTVVIGLLQYFKPQPKVENAKSMAISTDSLIKAYGINEKKADSVFLNKALSVNGTVAKVDTNQLGFTTVLFISADPLSSVFCTMRDKNDKPDSGKVVTIKGFCSGHTTDVLVTDCILLK